MGNRASVVKYIVAELAGLADLGFDPVSLGFDADEAAALLNPPVDGKTDPDEIPALGGPVVSALGDVWLLGRHRLICGDATDADTVARCLDGVAPHLMVTDPPYGVEYDATWRKRLVNSRGTVGAKGNVLNDDVADWREAWALFPGDVAYVWHAALHAPAVAESLAACGFSIRSQIIWDKTRLVIGRGDYHWQHEPCWYAVRKTGKGHWAGDRKQTTVWQVSHQRSETGHSTQKPVECMKRPIENNSSAGQAVYEPFSGSGTTIIAAEMTGRACHAIELNPEYVDLAVRRWETFTGGAAQLEGSGQSFADVASERAARATRAEDNRADRTAA